MICHFIKKDSFHEFHGKNNSIQVWNDMRQMELQNFTFLLSFPLTSLLIVAFPILDDPMLFQTHPWHILHENSEGLLTVVSKATVVLDDSFMVQVLQQLYLTL